MKPSERLKEIENKVENAMYRGTLRALILQPEYEWLIARVKRLTEALDKIGSALPPNALSMVARKALEDE